MIFSTGAGMQEFRSSVNVSGGRGLLSHLEVAATRVEAVFTWAVSSEWPWEFSSYA